MKFVKYEHRKHPWQYNTCLLHEHPWRHDRSTTTWDGSGRVVCLPDGGMASTYHAGSHHQPNQSAGTDKFLCPRKNGLLSLEPRQLSRTTAIELYGLCRSRHCGRQYEIHPKSVFIFYIIMVASGPNQPLKNQAGRTHVRELLRVCRCGAQRDLCTLQTYPLHKQVTSSQNRVHHRPIHHCPLLCLHSINLPRTTHDKINRPECSPSGATHGRRLI